MFKVSNSKIKTWRRCHYAAWLKYGEKLRKRLKSRPLTFGELAHKMIEYDAQDDDPMEVLEQLNPQALKLFEAERDLYGNLLEDLACIMGEYFRYWRGTDHELEYIPFRGRYAEHSFEIEAGDGIVITGKIDAFARTSNRLWWLVEHKTFTNMPNEDQLWRNLQSSLYVRVAEMLGLRVDGTCWDYIRSKPPAWPKLLKNGTVAKRGIDTLPRRVKAFAKMHRVKIPESLMESATKNRERYFSRIFTPTKPAVVDKVYADFLETAREMRDCFGKSRTKNIDRHCDWCEFESICRAELRGDDVDFVKKREFYVGEQEELIAERRSVDQIIARPPGVKHQAKY